MPGHNLQRGAAIYAPIVRAGQPAGYAAADFYYEKLFRTITAQRQKVDNLDTNYHLVISLSGERIFSSDATDATRQDELTHNHTYTIANRRLNFSLTPTNTALAADRRSLPEVALGAGIGFTLLLGLSVHLARTARAGQRAAEGSNKKLFTENEERRRIEARLKVSDERLRLALDSTQIGIFEWSVSAGHVYYSPGLWAMLGFEHVRMPSTVEVWQTLIHPDDLPLYRRRTETQLNGIATFIEPEYRVRARNGDWRWVYTRSKSVTAGSDGRPTRIIGTVQDITARREAKLALRESQAEARKFSLVAAKTDNPVLIGSADGKIEWANEAFCRVMEYSLPEVVGKNPAHFMVGPETNARTIVRIRAAMAHGHGISTDVVNYSKSGRKYHLHLEVQPVHDASGAVVNFIAVETDITARVETEQQLRRAKSEADAASRAKSEFLASMSHEIRTPMNGVIGMTSLLMETTLSHEQRDFVSTIRNSGEALLTIINDILDFSKIESGKMELERAPFELALCLEEALDLFALQASAKKLELGYLVEPDVPAWIMGDVTRLRQIIVNLVNNAVKFTPSGSISVQARRVVREPTPLGFAPAVETDPSRFILEFTVRDTGIGIPADRVDRLFKAFSQIDSSTTRKYGGTGLGLAISQRISQLMGGAIRVESAPGAGAAFIFTIKTEPAPVTPDSGLPALPAPLRGGTVLCIESHSLTQARLRMLFERWGTACVVVDTAPAALAAAAQLPQPPALLVLEGGETETPSPLAALASLKCPRLILFPFGQTAPTAPSDGLPFASTSKPLRTTVLAHAVISLFSASAAALARVVERPIAEEFPLNVLLAEDNAVNQKVALRFLERMGYHADAVGNGLEVLSALEIHRYDLILMDLQMPEMDGLEATRQIRARVPANRQPKIIALTANAMQGDRETCLAAGMDDYISKPVKMHEIVDAIRRQFGQPAKAKKLSPQVIG
ncbi:MAG: response regulator [Opitutus sp.]|nr:response regulator [Opitutus sp.]